MVRTIIFSKKYVRVLYMCFHSYIVVFRAPIPTGPRIPNFGSCSMSYSLETTRGWYSGLSGPVYCPTGMSARWIFPIWSFYTCPIFDPVAWVAFKLHVEGIRVSQALSIALQGWAPDESFLYGPSRHVEHVWVKIPQFHWRLVGWAGAIEPPAHNKSMRT